MTSFTTVGYGDISAWNAAEEIVCILGMVIGVAFFGYMTSTITDTVQNYDSDNAELNKHLKILNRIMKEYNIPLTLYENI